MKFLNIFLLVALSSTFSFSQNKVVKDSITVYGNCMQCKMRIEGALDIKGVKMADWNIKTKKLAIAYRSDKISEKEIHKIIASVGHDTDMAQSVDSTYSKLPFCCLFRDHDPHSGEGHKKEKKTHDHHH